jgi:hypothetical protein
MIFLKITLNERKDRIKVVDFLFFYCWNSIEVLVLLLYRISNRLGLDKGRVISLIVCIDGSTLIRFKLEPRWPRAR